MHSKPDSLKTVYGLIKYVIPDVNRQLSRWNAHASKCPDSLLSRQALSSISLKSFHAQGGSVYSLYPGANRENLVNLIVAYQTISDYLDNLCDRSGIADETGFSTLHISMSDALDQSELVHNYYEYYPYKDDGGYLLSLVNECKNEVRKLPSYGMVYNHVSYFEKIYSNLQTYKHLALDIREKKLFEWTDLHIHSYDNILPWEFWAASGSTLGIFVLFAMSSANNITTEEVDKTVDAYFPWVCGLHILLDYFIDYNEDIANNDLNFVQYYKNEKEILDRLNFFIQISLKKVSKLKYPEFHKTVILGLLAMYLSDQKAEGANLKGITNHLISSQGIKLKIMHKLCKMLRKKHVI